MCYSNPTPYQIEKRLENIKVLSKKIHYCPTCDSYGQSNAMVNHINKCDGTGLKNYWSRQKSDMLRQVVLGLRTLEEVEETFQQMKEESRLKRA